MDAIVTDPPYGLEFMGKDWDAPWKTNWQSGGGFSKPGLGDRPTAWPSFSATGPHGAANPTCASCGGRARGAKRCTCEVPTWKPIGKRKHPENEGLPDDMTSSGKAQQMRYFQAWCEEWARECLRVLKPGGYLLAFGGSRTYHRMACAVEDAGFEIRDQIMWVYGSGFPKILNVGKALDEAAGAEREVLTTKVTSSGGMAHVNAPNMDHGYRGKPYNEDGNVIEITAPATDAAKQWDGWGTALKPAHEPIVVARKPLIGTVIENVLKHGTGAMNIAGCRIAGEPVLINKLEEWSGFGQKERPEYVQEMSDIGRWPANLIHDGSDEVVELFPEVQSGVMKAGTMRAAQDGPGSVCYGTYGGSATDRDTPGDSGSAARFFKTCRDGEASAERTYEGKGGTNFAMKPGARRIDTGDASRFFYCAKASREDRNEGCDAFEKKPLHWSSGSQSPGTFQAEGTDRSARNNHPTVKPVSLMQYLVKLVTPPGGTVLDPFMGSGSTGKAAVLEGFHFHGIEENPEYVAIAQARIAWAVEEVERLTAQQPLFAFSKEPESRAETVPQVVQQGLFA